MLLSVLGALSDGYPSSAPRLARRLISAGEAAGRLWSAAPWSRASRAVAARVAKWRHGAAALRLLLRIAGLAAVGWLAASGLVGGWLAEHGAPPGTRWWWGAWLCAGTGGAWWVACGWQGAWPPRLLLAALAVALWSALVFAVVWCIAWYAFDVPLADPRGLAWLSSHWLRGGAVSWWAVLALCACLLAWLGGVLRLGSARARAQAAVRAAVLWPFGCAWRAAAPLTVFALSFSLLADGPGGALARLSSLWVDLAARAARLAGLPPPAEADLPAWAYALSGALLVLLLWECLGLFAVAANRWLAVPSRHLAGRAARLRLDRADPEARRRQARTRAAARLSLRARAAHEAAGLQSSLGAALDRQIADLLAPVSLPAADPSITVDGVPVEPTPPPVPQAPAQAAAPAASPDQPFLPEAPPGSEGAERHDPQPSPGAEEPPGEDSLLATLQGGGAGADAGGAAAEPAPPGAGAPEPDPGASDPIDLLQIEEATAEVEAREQARRDRAGLQLAMLESQDAAFEEGLDEELLEEMGSALDDSGLDPSEADADRAFLGGHGIGPIHDDPIVVADPEEEDAPAASPPDPPPARSASPPPAPPSPAGTPPAGLPPRPQPAAAAPEAAAAPPRAAAAPPASAPPPTTAPASIEPPADGPAPVDWSDPPSRVRQAEHAAGDYLFFLAGASRPQNALQVVRFLARSSAHHDLASLAGVEAPQLRARFSQLHSLVAHDTFAGRPPPGEVERRLMDRLAHAHQAYVRRVRRMSEFLATKGAAPDARLSKTLGAIASSAERTAPGSASALMGG